MMIYKASTKNKRNIFKSLFSLSETSFRHQLAATFSTGIIILAVLASLATYHLTSHSLRDRLIEEGLQFTSVLAEQAPLALLYQSADNVSDFAESFLTVSDVLGVSIYTLDRKPLLELGAKGFETVALNESIDAPVLAAENENQWIYVAAVYLNNSDSEESSPFSMDTQEPELLGFVKLVMSKQSLLAMAQKVLRGNFTAMAGLAVLLLLILLAITRRMVQPLADLAELMLRAEHGDAFVRADIHGPKDIANMQQAFNTMMNVLETREADLVTARDMALESAKAKGEFAANVTHELRTPLNGISGMLQLLESPDLNEQQLEYVNAAQSSAEALLMLINDILDFSKIDAGKASLQIDSFSVRRLIDDITGLLTSEVQKKSIVLRSEIAENIPDRVAGDQNRIRQVMFNLIGNAIKFTNEGEVVIRVELVDGVLEKSEEEEKLHLRFSVSDTGIGISKKALQKIFDAFTQADGSTSRNYGGTGLGLSISRQLVGFMGGELTVESELDEGSCFSFVLPLAKVEEAQESEQQQAKTTHVEHKESHYVPPGALILVVEDNRTNQQVAKGILTRIGCEVDIAACGEDALQIVFMKDYDAILMDVQMPGMDGYEVTRRIRKLEKEGERIPIIAITANNGKEDVKKCLSAGMDDFLSKPFKLDSLSEKLAVWIESGKDDNVAVVDTPDASQSGSKLIPEPVPAPVHGSVSDQVSEQVSGRVSNDDVAIIVEGGSSSVLSVANDLPVIDRATFQDLQDNAGTAFKEMMEVYLEDQLLYLEDIDRAIANSDKVSLKRSAHTLKGSSRNFGASQLSESLKHLEESVDQEDLETIALYIDPIRKAANSVREFMSEELDTIIHKSSLTQEEVTEESRILVVDDDRSMRLTFCTVLKNDGYTIDVCANGKQAVDYCKQETPDLILMDAMMPDMDGFTACKILRESILTSNTPVLIVTALDDESSIDRAFSAGANDFISKPVNFAVLRQRIARLLEASKAEKHVRHLAYHDTLTGLPNRRTFIENLQYLVSKPHDENNMIAVMFMDLDRFKLVNDTMGHDVGDLLLKAVTGRIKQILRSSDIIARLGGDEFTIILDHMASAEVVARIARKICDQLTEPFVLVDQQVYISTSIGIALYPTDHTDVYALIKFADTAMFKAKESRNDFKFYESGMETLVAKRMELENEMRKALELEEFTLHYQPQIDVESGEIAGMEALVRWQHPEKGMVSPGEFIPLAEETGLISALGSWVLKRACQQLREWLDKGYPPLILAVNISGRQLEDKQFVEKTLAVLEETNVPTECLELEITESVIMKNPEEVISVLEALKEQGISLAIDDFGTGHSSLNYLRRFPVDTLKIDRSFVNDISTPEDSVLVNGIIALAKSLHLKVIAEGVETHEQKVYLQEQRCDWIQGYYLYKPMPAGVVEEQAFFKDKATNF